MDGIILGIFSVLLTTLISISVTFSEKSTLEQVSEFLTLITSSQLAYWTVTLFLFVVGAFVQAVFESSPIQATPGKCLMGLKVQTADGNGSTLGEAFVRNFGKLGSILTLCFGYLMIVFTPKKQALHDMLFDLYVVKDPPVAPIRRFGLLCLVVVLPSILYVVGIFLG